MAGGFNISHHDFNLFHQNSKQIWFQKTPAGQTLTLLRVNVKTLQWKSRLVRKSLSQSQNRRGEKRSGEKREESRKVVTRFPQVFEVYQEPKERRRRGINRLWVRGKRVCLRECVCLVCLCICGLSVQCFIWRWLRVFPAHGLLSPGIPPGSARSCPCPSWCRPARLRPGTPCAFAWEDPQSGS